jgi:molybdopterin-guanine dinucleotide biosynthesis protein A
MTAPPPQAPWDAVVMAGGSSRRMGADKLALDVAGRPMLDRVLDAVADARRVVVVGPRRDTDRDVVWCREDPPGSGPAAALRAAIAHTSSDCIAVLAGDQPLIRATTIQLLLAAIEDDGAVVVDEQGEPQWLCSAWRTEALRHAALEPNGSLRAALSQLRWAPVTVDPATAIDCDTPDDLRRARELAQ